MLLLGFRCPGPEPQLVPVDGAGGLGGQSTAGEGGFGASLSVGGQGGEGGVLSAQQVCEERCAFESTCGAAVSTCVSFCLADVSLCTQDELGPVRDCVTQQVGCDLEALTQCLNFDQLCVHLKNFCESSCGTLGFDCGAGTGGGAPGFDASTCENICHDAAHDCSLTGRNALGQCLYEFGSSQCQDSALTTCVADLTCLTGPTPATWGQ